MARAAREGNARSSSRRTLPLVLVLFYLARLRRVAMYATAERLAMLIESSPRWARAELLAPNERVRAAAAYEIADYLAHRIDNPKFVDDAAQLTLPL
jgi:hypothetical protein